MLVLIFVFVNPRNIIIQGIYKGNKFQQYILVKNRHQDFPGYSIIFEEEIEKVIKFLDTYVLIYSNEENIAKIFHFCFGRYMVCFLSTFKCIFTEKLLYLNLFVTN